MRTTQLRRATFAWLLAVASCATAGPERAEDVLSFSVVPQRNVRETFDVWHPILDSVERRSGLTVLLTTCGHFEDHLKHLRTGAVDLAYTNPLFAKIAIQSGLYTTLVRSSDQLEGVIVAHKDSPIKQLKQLREHEVAFPSPYAFAAYLLPSRLFQAEHIQIKPRFVENQESVLLNVALRQVSAGAVAASIFKNSDPELREQLRILAYTQKTAPHPILVKKKLSPDKRNRILQALRDLEATNEGQGLLSRVPLFPLMNASEREYLSLPDLGFPTFNAGESPP